MRHYEKPLGEKVMEAIILTIAVVGTMFMCYGFYQILDVIIIRGRLSC